jgi:hypothetical protein
MDNAKTFQAIQYLSPEQQQQELLKKKPEVNDPDYALKLEAYGKLSSLVSRKNEAIQAQRDSRRFNEALSMGEKLDPTNKSMQKAADYTQTAQNFRINDGSTHDGCSAGRPDRYYSIAGNFTVICCCTISQS